MPAAPQLETRERLLRAAVEVFGRHGFAETSTRMLASAAEVNLQAIPYHFGSKEGLYLAAATHIADQLLEHLGPWRERARARIAAGPLATEEAKSMLADMLTVMASMLLMERSAPIARFVVREQMEPTDAFDHLYERVMEPQLELARKLVGLLLGSDPRSARVRLRTLALIGSVLFFRFGQATAKRQLGWSETGPRELAAIRGMVVESIAALGEPRSKS
jgi:AcrR family transcriptional regulator